MLDPERICADQEGSKLAEEARNRLRVAPAGRLPEAGDVAVGRQAHEGVLAGHLVADAEHLDRGDLHVPSALLTAPRP